MAPKKSKAEEKKSAPAEEPEAKKAKTSTEEPVAEKVEEKESKEKETKDKESEEKETDAPIDKRAALKEKIGFEVNDTTLNTVVTSGGKVLMTLAEGGMQYLIAGARANVGMKAGRYLFEIKILEALAPHEGHTHGGAKGPTPRQLVRLGFSTAGSAHILGDSESSVYFDSEGAFCLNQRRAVGIGRRFGRDSVVALLLNLDAESPNANTVSLFLNGQRASKPQLLPEALKGQPLFPHICFRNVTLQVNFGPQPLKALPFKCRSMGSAASADVVKAVSEAPKDGKYDVLFPVGFPGEGTFEWLDDFLAKNPKYTELSDRKIIEWAQKSGLPKKDRWASNDKPGFHYGLQMMDDSSVNRVINTAASLVPRHYVVMEVKQNLVASERTQNLKRFPARHFKRIAQVMMGEPGAAHKELVKKKILTAKQSKVEAEWKTQKAEKEKLRARKQKQKEIAARRKKADEQRKALQEQKKKEEAEKKEKEKKEKEAKEKEEKNESEKEKGKEEGQAEEAKPEETKAEEAKPEEEKEVEQATAEPEEEKEKEKEKEDEDDDEPEEEEDNEPPKAELTEEEANTWFSKTGVGDLTQSVLDRYFTDFSIPEKAEGFDEVRFEWQKESESKEYLKKWMLERKRTSRIDHLKPSEWFQSQQADFMKKCKEWLAKQKDAKAKSAKPVEDDDDLSADVMGIEDICDIGEGVPLFLGFENEDWALVFARWELHLLATAFKKDVDDPDRTAIPEQHVSFYYNKYFKKHLSLKTFGKDSLSEVVALIKESVSLEGEPAMLSSNLSEDVSVEHVMKLTEENRRERQRRIDAGDETARLIFTAPAPEKLLEGRSEGNDHREHRSFGGGGSRKGGKGGGKYGPRSSYGGRPLQPAPAFR